ncbi:unnamed protein product [Diamesa hyperborea]
MLLLQREYQNQFFAMAVGYFLMAVGGIHFAFGVANTGIGGQPWITTVSMNAITLAFISFHITSIIGAIAARFAYYRMNMTILNAINSLLITVGSITMLSLSEEYYGLVIGRVFCGLGFGSTYLSFIMYGSEISSPKARAQLIYLLHFFFTVGIAFYSLWNVDDEAANIITGTIGLSFSLMATFLGYFRLHKSHIQLLYNNSDAAALQRFQHFQRDHKHNPQLEVNEMKLFLNEEGKRSLNLFSKHNLMCLFLVIMAKVGYLAIWNSTHILIRSLFLKIDFEEFNEWTTLSMATVRLVGSAVGFLILDRIRRKFQFAISAFAAAALMFGFGIILQLYTRHYVLYIPPTIVLLPLEFFVGVGISHLSDLLKAEIFPLREKRDSIAIAIVLEEIIQITFIIISFNSVITPLTLSLVPFIFGAFTLLAGAATLLLLKESKHQNLRVTSSLYQK